MNHADLLGEVAQRAHVTPEAARAVLDAFADLVRQGRAHGEAALLDGFGSAQPQLDAEPRDALAVDALIERARAHPLGIEYLVQGYLGSVAATFQAHAFTVLAARERLRPR